MQFRTQESFTTKRSFLLRHSFCRNTLATPRNTNTFPRILTRVTLQVKKLCSKCPVKRLMSDASTNPGATTRMLKLQEHFQQVFRKREKFCQQISVHMRTVLPTEICQQICTGISTDTIQVIFQILTKNIRPPLSGSGNTFLPKYLTTNI